MTEQDRTVITKLHNELQAFKDCEEFTPEEERLCDALAWYCVQHDISVEEYKKFVGEECNHE